MRDAATGITQTCVCSMIDSTFIDLDAPTQRDAANDQMGPFLPSLNKR